MSSADPAQWYSVSRPREGHARFGQRCITSPAGLTTSVLQSGQRFGILHGFVPGSCSPAGPTTCGITSPARWTITRSPTPDVLATDVVLVVQGRAGDGDAADLHRLELRQRVQHAGAADPHVDRLKARDRRRRRPLVRTGEAGPAVKRAERLLLSEGVDLDHDPVDLVPEIGPPGFPGRARLCHLLDRLHALGVRVRAEAEPAEPRKRLPLRRAGRVRRAPRSRRRRSTAGARPSPPG